MYVWLECPGELISGCWTDGVFHLAAGHLGPTSGHYLSAVCGSDSVLLHCSHCHCHIWNSALQFMFDNFNLLRKDRLLKQTMGLTNNTQKSVRSRHCNLVRGLVNL